ncbi:MAG: hypothetical protein IIY99_00195 [Firmicutes bacterium]|nr:hypothetical protein [Bacillota bacterium]
MNLHRIFFKRKYRCPVCGKHYFNEIGAYEICPVCGWEDDPLQRREPDFRGGANKMSLDEAIAAYREEEDDEKK